MIKTYNKLVRDRIPEIIEESGKSCSTRILTDEEYDMSYRKKRIEVKATAYVHAWNKKRVSQIRTFSVAPSKNDYWSDVPQMDGQIPKFQRQSEVYVFCLNANQDIENHNVLDIDQWEFYVVPTYVINEYTSKYQNPNQKKISLGVVRSLSSRAVKFDGIRAAVDDAIDASDTYYRMKF